MARPTDVVRGTVVRQAASDTSGRHIASAIDRFGGALFSRLAAATNANVILSPYSVAVALAMTRVGAAADTRKQIDRVLHLDGLAIDDGFNALDQKFAALLTSANALWPQAGYPFASPFLERLASHYGAGVHPVDYEHHAERARRTINVWVSNRTADKIAELIPRGTLNALTRLVLTNAMYLKASWAEPFDPASTGHGSFVRRDGSAVAVAFMHKTITLGAAQGTGWQLVEIPYAGGRLAMDVILPDSGRLDAVERALRDGTSSFTAHLERRSIQLALPKFRCRTQANLVETLTALGLSDLFDPDRADLSAMTTAKRLYVSDVLHETFVEVDEAGTEAAAATAVVIALRSAPVEPFRFTVDRPFFLAIRDLESNSLLFLGRVLDPTA